MKRIMVAAGALLLGAGVVAAQQDVAVKQDNLMRAQAKSLYTVILKTVKGDIPYDQAAIDALQGKSASADVVWEEQSQ